MPDQGLSAKELRRIWNDEFLPSIRREIKTEILELKSSIKALTERCNELEKSQQYLRRDCLEINGIPISSCENPNQLVKEVGLLAGVEIDDRHIAAAHKLPDSKNVKNRLIVKFIQRDKREELYKHRKNLVGKNISHLPLVEDGNGKIFINESLTSYRKRLFGRIREYKRNNNLKYLWTSNGKIMLKVNDTSPTQAFVTHEQFEDYLDQISNH